MDFVLHGYQAMPCSGDRLAAKSVQKTSQDETGAGRDDSEKPSARRESAEGPTSSRRLGVLRLRVLTRHSIERVLCSAEDE